MRLLLLLWNDRVAHGRDGWAIDYIIHDASLWHHLLVRRRVKSCALTKGELNLRLAERVIDRHLLQYDLTGGIQIMKLGSSRYLVLR